MRRLRARPGLGLTALALVPATLSLSSAGEALAQGLPIPEIRLQGGQELRLPFSSVQALVTLPDGGFLVADLLEQALYRLNQDGTRRAQVGRNGNRPGEYLLPTELLPLAGDSALLFDGAQARYIVIRPDGTVGTTFQLRGEGAAFADRTPWGTDRRGGIYFRAEGPPDSALAASGPSDRAFILRYDRRNGRVTPVTSVRSAPLPSVLQPRGNSPAAEALAQVTPPLPLPEPFLLEDAWGIALDGRVAVARVEEDRVEWHGSGGAVMEGPDLQSEVRRVRVPDMRRWLADWQQARLSEGYPPQEILRFRIDDVDWPVYFPPFSGGRMPVDRSGNLWLLRSHPSEPEAVYEVIDGQGVIRARIVLPPNTRLEGFGEGALFLVRRDALGLHWLQRYPWLDGGR